MKTPQISIIVPVYNVEKYLPSCLDSILKQTYYNFELLLINDGSTDKSGIICDDYALLDKRIKIFHKQNSGVSNTRNLGIKNATGDWICFVDSDDILESNYLQVFVNLISKHKADCYITSYKVMPIKKMRSIILEESCYDKTNLYNLIIKLRNNTLLGYPWNKLFRTDIIKKNNIHFDELITFHEDEIFVLQYFKHSESIYFSPKQTYNYNTKNIDSLSKKYIEINTIFKINDILYELGSQFSQKKEYIEHINSYYADHLAKSIRRLYRMPLPYKRNQRLAIIRLIIKKAKEKETYNFLAKRLKVYHLYNLNHLSLLDFNGQLLYIYHRLKHSLHIIIKSFYNI